MDDPDSTLTPEERCKRLMEKVASMRVRYPANIKTNDKMIANMEAKLVQKDIMRRIDSIKKITLDKNSESLLEKSFELNVPDPKPVNDLIAEVKNLHKIIEQTRNDKIHKLVREKTDSESILNKIRTITD